jgi:hypothetical protein
MGTRRLLMMSRSIYAIAIACASVVHIGVLVVGVVQGWFTLDLKSMLLLSTAFLLAMLALCCAIWALRLGSDWEPSRASGFFLDCPECGRERDAEHSFCVTCGARA